MTSNKSELWQSLRDPDGEPTTIAFDWNDDHSSWRLEELEESIKEAAKILEAARINVQPVDHLYELNEYVENLRALYRDGDVNDATVRRALILADELHVSYETQSCDAQFEYDTTLEHLEELIESWADAHLWVFSEDEWSIDPLRVLENNQKERNGLGEHWKCVITDDSITLPNGVIIDGHNPNEAVLSQFDLITEQNYDEDEYGKIAGLLLKVDTTHHEALQQTLQAYAEANIEVGPRALESIINFLNGTEIVDLDKILETFSALVEEWVGDHGDLLITSSSLLRETVTA